MTDPRHHGHSSRAGQQYIRWSIYWSSGYDGVEPSTAGATTCRMFQWHRGAFRTGMVQRTVVAFRSVRQDATSEGIVQKLSNFWTTACTFAIEGVLRAESMCEK